MQKILGLDLGLNSIGLAIIDSYHEWKTTTPNGNLATFDDYIDKVHIINIKKKRLSFIDLLNILSRKRNLCGILTMILFVLAFVIQNQWQFWLNIGIGGIFIVLNMKDEKDES